MVGRIERVAFLDGLDSVLALARLPVGEGLIHLPIAAAGVSATLRATVEPDYPLWDLSVDLAADADGVLILPDASAARFLTDRADLLAAAELAGAGARMVAMTGEHLSSRTQFGQPLGVYQALKHRLAEAHVQVEASRAAILYAGAASDADDPTAEAQILGVKRFAGAAGKQVSETAMQLHGAIGYTAEYPLHQFMRRAHRLGASFTAGPALDQRLFNQFQNEAEGASGAARA